MTASDHSYETAGDRASLAREAGVGKLSFISVLAGVLVAYGAFAVLAALIGAAATAIGLTNDLSRNDWARLGTGSAIAAAVVLFLAYLFGGYVAFAAQTAPSSRAGARRHDELGVEHSAIKDRGYGSGVSFRDPDGIALEFFAHQLIGGCAAERTDGGILDLRKLFLIIGNSAMLLGMLLTVARVAIGVAQPWRRTGGVKVTAEPAIRPGTAVKRCALRPLCPGDSHEQPRSTASNG